MTHTHEVIVIGAGASGIACADELYKQGLDILLIEARSRIGGRALTVFKNDSSIPIELGAEFIHGAPSSILNLLQQHQQSFYDVKDAHLYFHDGTFSEMDDFFEQMEKIMDLLSTSGSSDRSVAEFLQQHKISAKQKKLFQSYVEGFEAANMNLIGERELAESRSSDDDELNGSQTFRLTHGYTRMFRALCRDLEQNHILKLNLAVKEIDWREGEATLTCRPSMSTEPETFKARKIVVTLPLGVLKSAPSDGGLEWRPEPPGLLATLSHIEMGHVQKIWFRFKDRFWEKLNKDPISFVHLGPDADFPTWWSLMPLRSTDLIAWQGGPRAQQMSLWPKEMKIEAALQTLSRWTGKTVSYLLSEIVSCESHDWSKDPLSLGAYSYIKVHGLDMAKKLSRSIEDTLYFAGEACAGGSSRGTISGAFDSGVRTAEQILKSYNKGSKSWGKKHLMKDARLSHQA